MRYALAATLERTLLHAFANEFELPDDLSIYLKDINLDKLKIQLQMLPDLLRTFNLANLSQKNQVCY